MTPDIIYHYFTGLTDNQKAQYAKLKQLYEHWNSLINVISRKDTESFYTRHVLHSLSIAKVIDFTNGDTVIDVGTGGGFPGIPLAIMFPNTRFTLLDSIGKKIKVVEAVVEELGLTNVTPKWKRLEEESSKYDYMISRAVMEFKKFLKPASKNCSKSLVLLKGGDLEQEMGSYMNRVNIIDIRTFFEEPFFETKKVIIYNV